MTAAPQPPDPLEWVRVAVDGLRHAQNLMLASVLAGFTLLSAVMALMVTEMQGLGDDMQAMEQRIDHRMQAMEQRIIGRIDQVDAKLTDARERVIRLEERERAGPIRDKGPN